MKNIIKNFIGNNGFTLIEAIISIAIVGIIVTPISFMFSKSLNDSIEAKEKLTVTELAREFIENIKAKPESRFMDFFGNTGDLNGEKDSSTSDFSGFGFPDIPSGYTVTISYDKSTFSDADNSYIVTESTSEANPDFILDLNSSISNTFSVEDMNAATPTTYNLSVSDVNERILHIYFYTDNSIVIKDGSGGSYNEIKNGGSSLGLKNINNAFSIKCSGTETETESHKFVPVKIYIHNEIPDQTVTTYIYKDASSTVDLSINDNPTLCEGMTEIRYNMKDTNNSGATRKIYSVKVSVVGPLGISTDITATKTDE